MQRFTTVIVNLMKKEKLFASLGGPIILSQALEGFFQTSNLSSCLLGVGVPARNSSDSESIIKEKLTTEDNSHFANLN
ncbi:hypothetical protein Dsin_026350 [Dipteronia sinensis]|uniref:Uncharacterized protein n=1 Tax=Dipteronia sinensis TaxID=43782 RepID=A0AAD9ZXT9_9ROSI|nr:hypothetical protein Dsin_026350 [Dipteronia sinensis]